MNVLYMKFYWFNNIELTKKHLHILKFISRMQVLIK